MSSKPSGIITTHLNADFDALASALAASLLHPGHVIVLPGGMERAARRFLERHPGLLETVSIKALDLEAVRSLVVVDTNQRGRIGPLAELVGRPGVEVTLYDHHGGDQASIEAHAVHEADRGANTTMMVERLKEAGIVPEPKQATLLALGIYEDTGSFTFSSTRPEDLEAAAWLIGKGADLEEVAKTLGSRFTPEHIAMLNELLTTAATQAFRGVDVTIAKASSASFVDDFAALAHELMDMAGLSVLFILGQMGDQVVLVGRSRCERIDVSRVLAELGGGGHPVAASAVLKAVTLEEAEERLIAALHKVLGTEPLVGDIMSFPVISVPPETPIYEVHDLIARYGISVVPVTEEQGRMAGFVTRNVVEKAVFHGIANQPVAEYMNTDFVTVAPDDPLGRVRELIVQGHQRFLPVEEDGRLVGIITRTDLLQVLSRDPAGRPEKLLPGRSQERNVARLMRQRLPAPVLELLQEAGRCAADLGCSVYVVGGFVRDLLLGRENLDIDLVVEGDGIRFARSLGQRLGARVKVHEKFKTAVVVLPDCKGAGGERQSGYPGGEKTGASAVLSGLKIDVATARFEYYEYPAAMPTVAESSIKLDLFRRDFTINTLAVRLDPKDFGLLIDFFGGQRDLRDGIIRVLHSLSFVDDPTRIFRAVRFEGRFGFRIGRHTLRLIRNSLKLGIVERLSGKRLLTELRHIMEEEKVVEILERLDSLSVLRAVHPALKLDGMLEARLRRLRDVTVWYDLLYRRDKAERWLVMLTGLASGLTQAQRDELAVRLGLAGRRFDIFVHGPRRVEPLWSRLEKEGEEMAPSRLCRLLEKVSLEELLLAMGWSDASDRPKRLISAFITELSRVQPELSGADLERLGFTPGPIYRRILDRLREARLDGEVSSLSDEEALVLREFSDEEGR